MSPTGVPRPEASRDARAGVRNVGLVLRPERDLDEALRQIGDWAAAMGVRLVGAEGDPACRMTLGAGPSRRSPSAATSFWVLVETARCSARCAWQRPRGCRCWASTLGGSGT